MNIQLICICILLFFIFKKIFAIALTITCRISRPRIRRIKKKVLKQKKKWKRKLLEGINKLKLKCNEITDKK